MSEVPVRDQFGPVAFRPVARQLIIVGACDRAKSLISLLGKKRE
jgi:hypothetical protein